MKDAVGEELERRWSEPWPWRSSLAAALAVHAAVIIGFATAPAHRHRSLQLPSVQVRMVAPAAAPAARAAQPPAGPPARTAPAPHRPPPKVVRPPTRTAPAPARSAVAVPRVKAPEPAVPPPTAASLPPGAADSGAERPDAGGSAGALRSSFGTVGMGAGEGGASEEPFPFTYYLNRFVSAVESNWFRPPAPAESRCRVRCRIDRGGRLVEAGIEDASGVPAFDRAALRAVYASAPFPPLPQGYTGESLTLHLDFGPQ